MAFTQPTYFLCNFLLGEVVIFFGTKRSHIFVAIAVLRAEYVSILGLLLVATVGTDSAL
jgi:hypothetical protein